MVVSSNKNNEVIKNIFATILLLLFTIFICLPVFIVNCAIRSLVSLLIPIFRPDLEDFVTSGWRGMFIQEISTHAKLNAIATVVLHGEVSLESFRLSAQQNLFDSRVTHTGGGTICEYESLKKTWDGFLGWSFWKVDPDFDLRHHIRDYDYDDISAATPGSTIDERVLLVILNKLADAPWGTGRSRWEMLRIPKFQRNKQTCTVLLIRFDHALLDGFSLMKLLRDFMKSEGGMPTVPLISKEKPFWEKVGYPFKFMYDFTKDAVMFKIPKNSIRIDNDKGDLIVVSPQIDVDIVKRIKNHFQVSYAAVLNAAVSGAIERALKLSSQDDLPEDLTSALIVPLPDHPGTMSLHASKILATWPLKCESRVQRLLQIQDSFTDLRGTTVPFGVKLYEDLLALYPMIFRRFIVRQHAKHGLPLCLISHFPVLNTRDYYNGHEIIDAFPAVGRVSEIGIFIGSYGVANKFRFTFTVNRNILPDSTIMKLGIYATEELTNLLKAI